MVRKFVLILATSAAVGGAAFLPTVASAGSYGYGPGEEMRGDVRDIHHDRFELRRDYEALGRDVAHGRYGAAQRAEAEIYRDRRELHRDYRELGHDLYRRGY
jgi:hypothetical protein